MPLKNPQILLGGIDVVSSIKFIKFSLEVIWLFHFLCECCVWGSVTRQVVKIDNISGK